MAAHIGKADLTESAVFHTHLDFVNVYQNTSIHLRKAPLLVLCLPRMDTLITTCISHPSFLPRLLPLLRLLPPKNAQSTTL